MRRRSEELEGFAGRVAHDLLNPISAAEMSLAAAERGAAGNERMVALAARASAASTARGRWSTICSRSRRRARGRRAGRDHVRRRGRRRRRRGAARARARARHHHRRRAPLVAPVAVRCANGVLASLMSNLVRNAIKHMGDEPRRQVDVRIGARRSRPLRGAGHGAGAAARAGFATRSIRTCAAPGRPSRAWAWASRPCGGWSRGMTAATASCRGRARARCSGSSCRPRGVRRARERRASTAGRPGGARPPTPAAPSAH